MHYWCYTCQCKPQDVLSRFLSMNHLKLSLHDNLYWVDAQAPNTLQIPIQAIPQQKQLASFALRLSLCRAIIHYDLQYTKSIFAYIANNETVVYITHANNFDIFIMLRTYARGALYVDLYTGSIQNIQQPYLQILLAKDYQILFSLLDHNIDRVSTFIAKAIGIQHYDIFRTEADIAAYFTKHTALHDIHNYVTLYYKDESLLPSIWHVQSDTDFWTQLSLILHSTPIPYHMRIITPSTMKKYIHQPMAFFLLDNQVLFYMLPSERVLLLYILLFHSPYTHIIFSSIPKLHPDISIPTTLFIAMEALHSAFVSNLQKHSAVD